MLRPVLLVTFIAGLIASCGGSTETLPLIDGSGGAPGTGGIGDSGVSGLGGHGGVDPAPDSSADASPAALQGLAFEIAVTPDDGGTTQWCQGPCMPATFLITKTTESTIEGIWGTTGGASPVVLTRSGPAAWELSGTLLLGKQRTWAHAMCDNETNIGPATFRFQDFDFDNHLDLSVSAWQVTKHCSDDYSTQTEGNVALMGRPDARTPKAVGPDSAIEPMHGVKLALDKPMAADAKAFLVPVLGGGTLPLMPIVMNGYVVAFETRHVLPLGTAFTTTFTGMDFAGIGTPAEVGLETQADFGVLTQDGFESGAAAGIFGGSVVESYGVPALHGQRMLQVPAGKLVLLHLQRSLDEQKLVMAARKYVACFGWLTDGPLQLEAAVQTANETHPGSVPMGAAPAQVDVDGTKITMGELQDVTIDLPETGKDVFVYVKGDDYMGAGCSMVGVLIDDIRLQ